MTGAHRRHAGARHAPAALWLALLSAFCTPALAADEDKDLELIPPAAQQTASPTATPAPPATSQTASGQRNYLEDAFFVAPSRGNLPVPLPSPAPASWEDRLFLDARDEWRLTDTLSVTYNGRFNLRAANDIDFPSHEGVRNDLREAFLSWTPTGGTWLDLGRINLKSGVAVGYNPTDFFKTRAVVEPLTADPSVLREDRLGTLMLLGQHVWEGGSLTMAYAPQVTEPTAIYNNLDLPSFDPMLDRTNAEHRFLLKASLALADNFNPELLVYHAGNRTQVGGNLTLELGREVVGYLEWAGGERASLIDDALRYGRQTGSLPANAPAVIPYNGEQRFDNDVSVGFSWTPAETRLTFNFEYHYHEAGFAPRDWHSWFGAFPRSGNRPAVAATLWYIRSYAQDQQEPISQHSAFVRADWVDAFVPDLELTALAGIDLQDGSVGVQATADYYLSRAWTIGALASFSVGGQRSDFGSLPQAGTILLRAIRYF